MKEQAAKERSVAIESPPKQPDIVRDDTVVEDIRGARNRIRELEKALAEEQAKTALLTAQVEQLNMQVTELSTSKKRKKIKIDSNEKLASFKDILHI